VEELRGETNYRRIERRVQLVIQALLDFGLMVIAAFGGRMAKRYSKVGELLLKLKALGESDAKLLKSIADMRNILVHAYANIKRDVVIDSASKLNGDAFRIVEALKSYVRRKAVDPLSTTNLVGNLSKMFKGKVKAALLFGGRVKGYSMKGDYDIAVYFGRP